MVAKLNRKIANQREYHLQKYTTDLVRHFDLIVLEDLKTKNLLQNHHLSRSIADAAWVKIKSMLAYKCDWLGEGIGAGQPYLYEPDLFALRREHRQKAVADPHVRLPALSHQKHRSGRECGH